ADLQQDHRRPSCHDVTGEDAVSERGCLGDDLAGVVLRYDFFGRDARIGRRLAVVSDTLVPAFGVLSSTQERTCMACDGAVVLFDRGRARIENLRKTRG